MHAVDCFLLLVLVTINVPSVRRTSAAAARSTNSLWEHRAFLWGWCCHASRFIANYSTGKIVNASTVSCIHCKCVPDSCTNFLSHCHHQIRRQKFQILALSGAPSSLTEITNMCPLSIMFRAHTGSETRSNETKHYNNAFLLSSNHLRVRVKFTSEHCCCNSFSRQNRWFPYIRQSQFENACKFFWSKNQGRPTPFLTKHLGIWLHCMHCFINVELLTCQ